jgi:hypothetical protein
MKRRYLIDSCDDNKSFFHVLQYAIRCDNNIYSFSLLIAKLHEEMNEVTATDVHGGIFFDDVKNMFHIAYRSAHDIESLDFFFFLSQLLIFSALRLTIDPK